ncbi:hypothetical protein ABIB90_000525 [Bradyrhizobium sp. JR4.1]|uniref:hypothetical protein n=1 Tax=Bradyrhizobium sp. JR4.1 TaxID=3156372 RepID=UPI00339722CA
MAKEQLTQKLPAREAFDRIEARLGNLMDQREEIVSKIRALEKTNIAGVPEVFSEKPADIGADRETRARALLEGAQFGDLPPRREAEGVRLFRLQQQLGDVDRAIELARSHVFAAAAAATQEAVSAHKSQVDALHRRRALAIVNLLKLNDEIGALRSSLGVGGVMADGPLDAFTPRLFGGSTPSALNSWPKRYLEACIAAGIVTEKETQ